MIKLRKINCVHYPLNHAENNLSADFKAVQIS